MPDNSLLKTFLDSGVPEGSTDYTTLVIIHGWGFHAGNFKKLLPLARENNVRIVLPNRRDYPGSTPFSPDEVARLTELANATVPGSPEAVAGTQAEMKARARELYDYLVELVTTGGVLRAQGSTRGIILAGWSMGATWIAALLAHVAEFPVGEVRLGEYVRRLVLYDPSYLCFGYPLPAEMYHPLHDHAMPVGQRIEKFGVWVMSYFTHGDLLASGLQALSDRNAAEDLSTMSAEDMEESISAAGAPGGCEDLFAQACFAHGVYEWLRKQAFILRDMPADGDDWRSIELRHIWCDRSIWEMPLLAWTLPRELEDAKKAGRSIRTVNYVRFRGANHFAHWDFPEKMLRGFLSDDNLKEI